MIALYKLSSSSSVHETIYSDSDESCSFILLIHQWRLRLFNATVWCFIFARLLLRWVTRTNKRPKSRTTRASCSHTYTEHMYAQQSNEVSPQVCCHLPYQSKRAFDKIWQFVLLPMCICISVVPFTRDACWLLGDGLLELLIAYCAWVGRMYVTDDRQTDDRQTDGRTDDDI